MVSSSPSSEPGRSGIATTSTPQSAACSRLVALTLRTSSAPPRRPRGDLVRVEAVDRDAEAPVAERATASPTPPRRPPGRSPGRSRRRPRRRTVGLGDAVPRWRARRVIDLGEDLDVVGAVTLLSADRPGRNSGADRAGLPDRARPDTPGLLEQRAPGRRGNGRAGSRDRCPAGTSRCRPTQLGVISAATEIGRTATSAANPRAGPARRAPGGERTRPGGR